MSFVSKDPSFWSYSKIKFEPIEDDKIYRIVHLRDAYFLDNMYFRGRKAAEQYLHLHMCKVASYKDVKIASVDPIFTSKEFGRMHEIIEDNRLMFFDIVEA
jgi:hypothetical protein